MSLQNKNNPTLLFGGLFLVLGVLILLALLGLSYRGDKRTAPSPNNQIGQLRPNQERDTSPSIERQDTPSVLVGHTAFIAGPRYDTRRNATDDALSAPLTRLAFYNVAPDRPL
tara:strand:+ start:1719 stop:2057 length:339 start_codon:yes stop_codon:yes gene_type:complete